jgi:hypothetical protein
MFAAKARPLMGFLRENALAPMQDEMSKHAFKQFKLVFQATLILWTLNWNKPFLIYFDAFEEVMGNTLSQLDKNGHDHSIHFASRQLTLIKYIHIVTE